MTASNGKTDPTALTTEQLIRAIDGLREILEAAIKAETDLTHSRFKGVENAIAATREFAQIKFEALETQNQMIEKQRIEQKQDVKAAVDAALAAQKEAVKEQTLASERSIAKSEAATAKQMEQMSQTFGTSVGSVAQQVGDAKDRIQRLETQLASTIATMGGTAKGKAEGYGNIVTTVLIGVALITLILKFVVV